MNIDELTIGQAKELRSMLAGTTAPAESSRHDEGSVKIVALGRGNIFIGNYHYDGCTRELRNCRVIRRWGTEKGLGQLASDGPQTETKLDPCGIVRFHELNEVFSMAVDESKWSL